MELTVKDALLKGVEAHKAGKLQEADQLYTAILKAQPNHPDANHNMGVLAVGLGKVKEALPFFKQALGTNDTIAQFWLSYIDVLIKLNRSKEAQEILLQAKDKGMQGEAFNQIEARMTSFTETLAQEPPEDQLQPVINLYSQGQYQKLLAQSAQLLKTFPQSPSLFNFQGAAYAGLKQFGVAIESYQQALKIKPDYAEAFYNMGIALQEKGDIKEAIKNYQQALKINPHYAKAYNNRGLALQGNGDLEVAIESYKQALKIKPDYAEAFYNMGIALNNKGDQEAAIESYKQAIKINSHYAEAYYNMGVTFQDKGDLESAMESFIASLRIAPNSASSIMNLNHLKATAVPSWHLAMMNDTVRNGAYLKALQSAITGQELVLDIGTGAGLLSMMAADCGAEKIVTCEVSPTISKIAKRIINNNGYSKKISVINKNSTELNIGEDLPRKADILVSEILSSEFVGEGIQSSILDANKRLLKKNGKIIPESGEIIISLIENNNYIANQIFVDDVNGYDLSEFNSISQYKFTFPLKEEPVFMSKPKKAFSFDLYATRKMPKEDKVLKLTVNRDGVCAGLIQWIKVKLYKDIEYENNPIEIHRSKVLSHWRTPIYRFDNPIEVKLGQVLEVNATLFTDSVWFSHCTQN